ncbi:nucleotide sugar dehydrogenase [Nocardia brasiliensis]|uniref:nucleotide sugar dehydrogenase n=1 Tax=Nocardia brasiliensis TaxID=37326 RepID=UPI0024581002|nr:nucleotide sugar dehydrogenase [Nocardia brasiliensis]
MPVNEISSDTAVFMPRVVVVGIGYVGLRLCSEAAQAGHEVIGLDIDTARVAAINAGEPPVGTITREELASLHEQGFTATSDPVVLSSAQVIVICVPTPLRDGQPDLELLRAACRTIRDHLQPGTLVCLESTTYPGTTEDVVAPILTESGLIIGKTLNVAYSPERIDPGNKRFTIANTPKVVAGVTDTCTTRALAFYFGFVDDVVVAANPREAEMAKLLENTYRNVNIALVNELAIACDGLGIDIWNVIGLAATKPFGFQSFSPGPGVGGHCIPVDPGYLSATVRTQLGYPIRLVEVAQEVNQRMPAFVVERIGRQLNTRKLALNGARILLVGVSYKSGVADMRESPAIPIARALRASGAVVHFHDRYVQSWTVDGEPIPRFDWNTTEPFDLGVMLQHDEDSESSLLLSACAVVLDTRGHMKGEGVVRL